MSGAVEHVCLHCKFWQKDKKTAANETKGRCHRFPPSAPQAVTGGLVTYFPSCDSHDWCGEFVPKG